MAGLDETCTHIAAVLFYIEAVVRIQGARISIQSQCAWAIPSYVKSIDYQPIKKIDFMSACGKKRKLDEMIEQSVSSLTDSMIDKDDSLMPTDSPVSTSEDLLPRYCVTQPTDNEISQFIEALSVAGTKPAILSLISPYSDEYVPKSLLSTFPKPLKSLQQPVYTEMQYHELLAVSETVSLDITTEMSELIEKETKSQYKSTLWFKYRAGRITSSHMKAVCYTDAINPSQSLIKSICYPEEFAFTNKRKHC